MEFSSNTRSNTPRMESVNRETKVREELAWVYVQFLFLASFSAPLVDGASGLRVRGHVCDSQNWFYFPIPEDRIYSSWHNHPLTHGRPQNTGHTNRSEMILKLVNPTHIRDGSGNLRNLKMTSNVSAVINLECDEGQLLFVLKFQSGSYTSARNSWKDVACVKSTETKKEFVRSLWANDVPNSQTPINSHYTPFGEK